jgi:hypothetical protein
MTTRKNFSGAIALWAAALGVFSTLAIPAAALGADSPVWSASLTPTPSNLVRLGEGGPVEEAQVLTVFATNVGGAPTTGTVTITDTLPDGVELDPARELSGTIRVAAAESTPPMACSNNGQVMTCEGTEAMVAGETMLMEIPILISPSAPDSVIDAIEVSGGGAGHLSQDAALTIGGQPVPGFEPADQGVRATMIRQPGESGAEAGSHPFQAAFDFGINNFLTAPFSLFAVAEPKAIDVTLPRGMYANPLAVPRCTAAQLETDRTFIGAATGGCPHGSQVGVSRVFAVGGGAREVLTAPIFNMVPPPGSPAMLAFDVEAQIYVHLIAHVSSDGEYEITARTPDLPAKLQLLHASVYLWGDPTDAAHDRMRGVGIEQGDEPGSEGCIGQTEEFAHCPTTRLGTSFVTIPSDCPGTPLTSTADTTSWQHPEESDRRQVEFTSLQGQTLKTEDCAGMKFAPTIESRPTDARADSPTGLDFRVHQPQDLSYEGRATANLKDAEVTLPEGIAVNPSSASGLSACTEAQMGYQPSAGRLRFSEAEQTCPDAAKIGTVRVSTPLIDHTLPGSIYVAKPYDNPFGSLLSIYLAIEDEESGIVSKLAGKVIPDPKTGRLTATFTENPELPLEDIDLYFFPGDGASLKTGLTCGSFTTTSSLVPWSTPEGATAHPTDTFTVASSASGAGSCPTSEAGAPFAPSFQAGTSSPVGGAFSPFVLRIARADGEQHLTAIDTTLPKGLLGRLAGVPYCPEAGIAAARSLEAPQKGVVERAQPSCPAASEVGSVTVGAGAGPTPYYVGGHAYLAGPYKGAPLSLVVITPAIAGPFDLGNVVNRVALQVEPFSAQIHAVSDPLPTILDGIPLDLRSIALRVDRPGFILNPTSCQEKRITGIASSEAGASAQLLNRFQAEGCSKLGFRPTLKLSLSGATRRTGHPALKAVVTYPKKGAYANIARAQVSLPHAEFLDQENLTNVCTQVQLKSQSCPKSSIYGRAKAWSPLLDRPIEGNVYLGVGFGYKLPALVAELDGQIRVMLKGKIDTDAENGIRNTFEAVPDAPVSRFELRLKGGRKYGLLENSENLCRRPQKALTRFSAQNGIVDVANIPIANDCGVSKKKKKGASR